MRRFATVGGSTVRVGVNWVAGARQFRSHGGVALPPVAVLILFVLGALCIAGSFVCFYLHADGRGALWLVAGLLLQLTIARGQSA